MTLYKQTCRSIVSFSGCLPSKLQRGNGYLFIMTRKLLICSSEEKCQAEFACLKKELGKASFVLSS